MQPNHNRFVIVQLLPITMLTADLVLVKIFLNKNIGK